MDLVSGVLGHETCSVSWPFHSGYGCAGPKTCGQLFQTGVYEQKDYKGLELEYI